MIKANEPFGMFVNELGKYLVSREKMAEKIPFRAMVDTENLSIR